MLLAMALAGGPDAQAVPPKPVGGSIAGLFSADDYPQAAATRGEQGKVEVVTHVDDKGAVRSCEIKVSSGYPDLDTRTCEIIARRATFLPALDAAGHAVAGDVAETITWRLDSSPSKSWASRMTLRFDHDRHLIDCTITLAGAAVSKAQTMPCPASALATVNGDFSQLPDGTSSLIMETSFNAGPAAPAVLEQGDILLGRGVAEFTVDAAGHVANCTLVEASGRATPKNPCPGLLVGTFDPRPGPDGKPVPYTATLSATLYARTGKRKEGGKRASK